MVPLNTEAYQPSESEEFRRKQKFPNKYLLIWYDSEAANQRPPYISYLND